MAAVLRHRGAWTDSWSVSGVTRLSSGLPVTFFNNNDMSLLGTIPNGINSDGLDTPNYTPGDIQLNLNARNGRPAFNTSLFSLPAIGSLGTAGRRMFSGPRMANLDAALTKQVRVSERATLNIRVEAFNGAHRRPRAPFAGGGIGPPLIAR